MNRYLDGDNFPCRSEQEALQLSQDLSSLLEKDSTDGFYAMLAGYQRVLADNMQRHRWPEFHNKLETLFKCGKPIALDGPMIGIPVSIRDSDYFKDTVEKFGQDRSMVASIEWMATAWNATFADTGLWMGKTYEPTTKERIAYLCDNNPEVVAAFNEKTTRIGRNFFRPPPDSDGIQGIALPTLTKLWNLIDRPQNAESEGFQAKLLDKNLDSEKLIPYSKTGGFFVADLGHSVVPEMNNKTVYQLNYRWTNLDPVYPMTRLIDEVVQIAEGIYLGQLVYATKHYSLGTIDLPFIPGEQHIPLGESYNPMQKQSPLAAFFKRFFSKNDGDRIDYGYQNNGYFLMMDPAFAKDVYADNAFPQLRPRRGEMGYEALGYQKEDEALPTPVSETEFDWANDWKSDDTLREKFTSFILEPSPKEADAELDDISTLLADDESILQMLQRISADISAQTKHEDHLRHFETLHRLFRSGVAPGIENGLFKGSGKKGFNSRLNSDTEYDWYGEKETTQGFDYYHGATLNLHCGFAETFAQQQDQTMDDGLTFPSALAMQVGEDARGPNVMNMVWQSIGKYVFPWAGKSFEKISPRKLSMLVDESDDLEKRYPERVKQLRTFLASAPHYALVKKNHSHYWQTPGLYAPHLASGSWDQGMSDEDKAFWEKEANERWVFGNNLQDERVLAMDVIMRIVDMNYRTPDPVILKSVKRGPTPFVRQGYVFLGAADQQSILPTNNGTETKKRVFQFQYRFPMIGGAMPIGYCLDELVEIADGLYLGQLIYSTALNEPFQSAQDPDNYRYQLFGYFLLMDNEWQQHRQAIGLDVWRHTDKSKDRAEDFSFI